MANLSALMASVLAASLNLDALDATQKAYSSFTLETGRWGSTVKISTNNPGAHLSGLVMRTTPQRHRSAMREAGDTRAVVLGFLLDRGIFTRWRFMGSTGPDALTFGPQGHIISKQLGGVVDFRPDAARDVFTFTNKIDVAKCSEKHGIQCHPLNHLQRVTIKNFGPEDRINLQGKVYGYGDVKNGVLPGVPPDRLRVELIP
jgi:hypothetical protein